MRRSVSLILFSALILALSLGARVVFDSRIDSPRESSWFVEDPDTLYHARRVERALDSGLSVASNESLFNHPHGSAIPWPPYYDQLLTLCLAPFAPEDPTARHEYVEKTITFAPLVFGVITSLLAAAVGLLLAGRGAALVAGVGHSLCYGSIAFSRLGNGDHHAFISLLTGLLLAGLTLLWKKRWIDEPRKALTAGLVLGALAGILLGSWAGSTLAILVVQATLGWAIVRQSTTFRAGLSSFGIAFHLSAFLVVLPALLSSPWLQSQPWVVVNLSYFHGTLLLLGALVFVPLRPLKPKSTALRRYPWILLVILGSTFAVGVAAESGAAMHILQGFSWAGSTPRSMGGVMESQPLIGPGTDPTEVYYLLGYWVHLLPLALAWAAWQALRRGRDELVPWILSGLLFALLASRQMRFTESLSLPLTVLIGWAAGSLLPKPKWRLTLSLLVAVTLLQWPVVRDIQGIIGAPKDAINVPARRNARADRSALQWLRNHDSTSVDQGVMASWSHGHAIQWVAGRPTLTNNFAGYVGTNGFRAHAYFFLSEDDAEAERTLKRRKISHVYVTCHLPENLRGMVRDLDGRVSNRYFIHQSGVDRLRPAWYETLGARLIFAGLPPGVSNVKTKSSPDFLRLVYISPVAIQRTPLTANASSLPYACIWERVRGARIEARGEPGTLLQIDIELLYPGVDRPITYSNQAGADEQGRAKVRVPYATPGMNGDGQATGPATWSFGNQSGTLVISSQAVLEAKTIRLP